jgi:hypothetical protein
LWSLVGEGKDNDTQDRQTCQTDLCSRNLKPTLYLHLTHHGVHTESSAQSYLSELGLKTAEFYPTGGRTIFIHNPQRPKGWSIPSASYFSNSAQKGHKSGSWTDNSFYPHPHPPVATSLICRGIPRSLQMTTSVSKMAQQFSERWQGKR